VIMNAAKPMQLLNFKIILQVGYSVTEKLLVYIEEKKVVKGLYYKPSTSFSLL